MGEAREVVNRQTAAMVAHDFDAVAVCYAERALAVVPGDGEILGRANIAEWFRAQADVFSDSGYESLRQLEVGNVTIDEGYFTGTHSGPLPTDDGGTVPATGKAVRLRTCDVATVEDGLITEHHFYFDQLEALKQLGIAP